MLGEIAGPRMNVASAVGDTTSVFVTRPSLM